MAGRPQAPRSISNAVLPRNRLTIYSCTPREIYSAMNDQMQWLQWLAEHRLVQNNNDCGNCQAPMALVRRNEAPEGFSWKCRPCNTRCSVRTGSFFANCVLSSKTIVMLMYYWTHAVKSTHVMLFENIVDWHVIVDYNNFFRVQCEKWVNRQQVDLGGFDGNGQPIVVEVDESYFFRRKFHRGRRRRGTWVVGLVERATGKCWLEIVLRRDAATLEQIILAHVLPGTVVMTDAWGGYVNVPRLNNGVYMHEVVVHAQNFVDPHRPDVHTQTIEGMWMQVKRKLRYQSGTSRDLFPSYLSEFQWRYSHKSDVYGQYLCLLSDNYGI
jgi:hypothetical protein